MKIYADNQNETNTTQTTDDISAAGCEAASEQTSDSQTDVAADSTEKKISLTENSLELKSMSAGERRRFKREAYEETTRDMSPSEKKAYFISYYKWHIIIPIAAVIIIAIFSITIYINTRPIGLSYVILNVADQDAVDTSFYDDYAAYNNISDKEKEISSIGLAIDFTYYMEHENSLMSNSTSDYYKLSSNCEFGNYDVIITDRDGLKYCTHRDIIQVLDNTLSPAIYEALSSHIVTLESAYGEPEAFAVDISDTAFARELNAGYSKMYVVLPYVTNNDNKNAIRFLSYVFDMDLNSLN